MGETNESTHIHTSGVPQCVDTSHNNTHKKARDESQALSINQLNY